MFSLYCDVSIGRSGGSKEKDIRSDPLSCTSRRKTTSRLVAERFVWLYMQRDVKNLVHQFPEYQTRKLVKHERPPLAEFLQPDERFAKVQIDM